jgi:hypothetical protein
VPKELALLEALLLRALLSAKLFPPRSAVVPGDLFSEYFSSEPSSAWSGSSRSPSLLGAMFSYENALKTLRHPGELPTGVPKPLFRVVDKHELEMES